MILALVPAYNESKNIGSVVRSLFDHVDEIVVVDDASSDETAAIARNAGATVISHRINRGQGASLETGHTYAREQGATYVIHFDGDGQFTTDDIAPALRRIKEHGADVLLGSRYLGDVSEVPYSKRYILLPLARCIHKVFYRLHLTDAHNGFRVLSRNALNTISITQDRMAHATEIPALALRHGLILIEHPVKISYHEYGQGVGGGFAVVKDLFIGKLLQ